MARRHPAKGCHCRTCERDRAYYQEHREERLAYFRKRYAELDPIKYAREATQNRNLHRRRAEERDAARLADLTRRTL